MDYLYSTFSWKISPRGKKDANVTFFWLSPSLISYFIQNKWKSKILKPVGHWE